jgi:hypothetical protein
MASPSTPIMVGGAKLQDSVLEWSKKSLNLYSTVFLILLVICVLFADKLPIEARWQLSTTAGRLLLLLLLYITHLVCGWQAALLFTIAIALVWAARPVFKPVGVPDPVFGGRVEGFNDMKKTDVTKHKWFIEKTLHENPTEIVEDRINTSAVQDNSSVANGTTSR